MLRRLKAANTRERIPWRETAGAATTNDDAGPRAPTMISLPGNNPPCSGDGIGTRSGNVGPIGKDVPAPPAQRQPLSVRAENVLKQLAADLAGENPPAGTWVPSSGLLRKLSFEDLQTARNCGPQTTDEIIRWARSQGVVIERPFHAGKSLSTMWRDVIARYSAGECTNAEIAEALERSRRRKNTRIPVALQSILVKALNATGK